jgi:hypothetical protein
MVDRLVRLKADSTLEHGLLLSGLCGIVTPSQRGAFLTLGFGESEASNCRAFMKHANNIPASTTPKLSAGSRGSDMDMIQL